MVHTINGSRKTAFTNLLGRHETVLLDGGLAVHRAVLSDVLYSKVLASNIDIITGIDILDAVFNSGSAFFRRER